MTCTAPGLGVRNRRSQQAPEPSPWVGLGTHPAGSPRQLPAILGPVHHQAGWTLLCGWTLRATFGTLFRSWALNSQSSRAVVSPRLACISSERAGGCQRAALLPGWRQWPPQCPVCVVQHQRLPQQPTVHTPRASPCTDELQGGSPGHARETAGRKIFLIKYSPTPSFAIL